MKLLVSSPRTVSFLAGLTVLADSEVVVERAEVLLLVVYDT
jgi:hypothetical protein